MGTSISPSPRRRLCITHGLGITSLLGTLNIMQWDNVAFLGPADQFQMPNTTDLVALADGFVDLSCRVAYAGNNARYSPNMAILVNGVATPARGKEGYIRNANGDTQASVSIEDIFAVSIGDIITIQVNQESGGAGAVTDSFGQSVLTAEYVEVQ